MSYPEQTSFTIQKEDTSKATFFFSEQLSFGIDEVMLMLDDGRRSVSFKLLGAKGAPEQYSDSVIYKDAIDGIDVSYSMSSQGVKETIVLNDLDAADQRLDFMISSKNVELRYINGKIIFFDDEPVWSIEKPFMVDSAGAVSHAVEYVINDHDGATILSLIPDKAWLLDPERKYPIFIDPTVTLQSAGKQNLGDTYAYMNNTIDNSGSPSLFTGSAFNSPVGSYVRFNMSEFIGKNRTIQTAYLVLYHFDDSSNNTNQTYSVFNISDQDWSETSCYNQTNCPSIDSLINTTTPDGEDNTNYTQEFDITDWFRAALNKSMQNISVFINRTYNNSMSPDFDRFASKEYYLSSKRPKLVVFYYEPCTPESDWIINGQVLCQNKMINSSTLFVNGTGMLIFRNVTYNQSSASGILDLNGTWKMLSSTTEIHSNLTVNGNMTINSSSMSLTSTYGGSLEVSVEENGSFLLLNASSFDNSATPSYGYHFTTNESSTIEMKDSTIIGAGESTSAGIYGRGIHLRTTGAEIVGCAITSQESNVSGIVLEGPANIIANNTITLSGATNSNQNGIILLFNQSSNFISGNTITVSGTFSNGLFASENVTSTTISDNHFLLSGDDSTGLYLKGALLNLLRNNLVNMTGDDTKAVFLNISGFAKSLNNSFINTTIYNAGDDGEAIRILQDCTGNQFAGGYISTLGGSGTGISLNGSHHTNISGFNINALGALSSGISIDRSNETFVYDSNISTGTGYDVQLDNYNLTFIGTNFTKSDTNIINGTFYVKWKLDVYVTNRRDPLNGSNVTIKNMGGSTLYYGQTGMDGFIPTQSLLEYFENMTGQYHTDNYTVEMNYTSVDAFRNITLDRNMLIIIEALFPCSNPSSGDWTVVGFEYCNNTRIYLTGDLYILPPHSLEFDNVTLIVNGTSNGQRHIYNYNYFKVNHSNLTSISASGSRNYQFWNMDTSELDMYNSKISYVGYNDPAPPYRGRGIYIKGNHTDFINNTYYFDNVNAFKRGLNMYHSHDNVIADNNFTYMLTSDSTVIWIGNESSDSVIRNNHITISSSATNTRGIYLYQNENNSIENNNIRTYGSFGAAVYFSQSMNSFNINNTFFVNGFDNDAIFIAANSEYNLHENNTIMTISRLENGFYIINSMHNTIRNNVITTTYDDSHGIFISQDSGGPVVTGNNVITTGDDSYAFYSDDIANATVDQNNFSTSGDDSFGAYIKSSRDSTYSYNNIMTTGIGSYGAYLYYSRNIVFINNTINSTNADSIVIQGNSPTMYNHTFTSNTVLGKEVIFINNEHDKVFELNRSNAGIIYIVNCNNVTVVNVTITGAYGANILFTGNSSIMNFNITTALDSAVRVDTSKSIFVFDSNFHSNGTDIRVRERSNMSFVNSSFTEGDVVFTSDSGTPFGRIDRMWYVSVYVNDSEFGTSLSNVRVIVDDKNGYAVINRATNNSGFMMKGHVKEYTQNTSGRYYYNNHTINLSRSDYFSEVSSYNITDNLFLYIDLLLAISNAQINLTSTQLNIYAQDFEFNGTILDADFELARYYIYHRDYKKTIYWNQTSATGPAARGLAGMDYVDSLDSAIMFGGYDASPTSFNDTWLFNFTTETWRELTPASSPEGIRAHGMAYDSDTNTIVVMGGRNAIDDLLNSTWILNVTSMTWTEISKSRNVAGLARTYHSMVYSSSTGMVYAFGGLNSTLNKNDLWRFNRSDSNWTKLLPSGELPLERRLYGMAYMDDLDMMMLFGGFDGVNYYNDTWFYNISANRWFQRNQTTTPTPRTLHGMVYDSAESTAIIYSGIDGGGLKSDTWYYNYTGNSWRQIQTEDEPPARSSPSMAFRPSSRTLVLFSGGGAYYNDTWLHGFDYGYHTNFTRNWTNGTLLIKDVPTNSTLNVTLISINSTMNKIVKIIRGSINASYLMTSPINGRTGINVTYLVQQNIFDNSFLLSNQSINNSVFVGSTFNITNLTDNGLINSSFLITDDLTNYTFKKRYDGIYLPAGEWEIEVWESDSLGRNISGRAYLHSRAAIQQSLVGGNTTAVINGSDAVLYYDVKTKSYPYVRYYMNLSDGGINVFDNDYAQIGNSTVRVNISDSPSYVDAGLFSLNASTSLNVPSYIYSYDGLYNELVRLYITPYEGLSAGQYIGMYGWGLDDGN